MKSSSHRHQQGGRINLFDTEARTQDNSQYCEETPGLQSTNTLTRSPHNEQDRKSEEHNDKLIQDRSNQHDNQRITAEPNPHNRDGAAPNTTDLNNNDRSRSHGDEANTRSEFIYREEASGKQVTNDQTPCQLTETAQPHQTQIYHNVAQTNTTHGKNKSDDNRRPDETEA